MMTWVRSGIIQAFCTTPMPQLRDNKMSAQLHDHSSFFLVFTAAAREQAHYFLHFINFVVPASMEELQQALCGFRSAV